MNLNLSNKDIKNSKIALLGDGLIGTGLNQYFEAIDWGGPGFEYKQFSRKLTETDLMDFPLLEKLLLPYDVIVNTIAHTDTKDKQKNTHWNVNYVFAAFLADFCATLGKRLVHISTDYVYAGSSPIADEKDVLVPFGSWYSCTKLMADNHIELKGQDYLIIRTAHKASPFPFKKGYINVIGSFQSVFNAVIQMNFLIMSGAKGVYNIGPKAYKIKTNRVEASIDCDCSGHNNKNRSRHQKTMKHQDFLETGILIKTVSLAEMKEKRFYDFCKECDKFYFKCKYDEHLESDIQKERTKERMDRKK